MTGKNYIIGSDGVVRKIDMDTLDIDNGTAQNVTIVVNDEYGAPFTETLKLGFGAKFGGDFKQALKGSNLDARKGGTGDDLELLLNEAFEDDGFDLGGGNMVDVAVLSNDTVKMSFTVGGVTDMVTVNGAYVEGYLAETHGNNYIIGNDGKIRKKDMHTLDIDDGIAQNVTIVVNDAYGSKLTETLKLGFGAKFGGDFKQALKGSNLDARKGRTGDDLELLLNEAFEDDGFDLGRGNMVGVDVVSNDTVKLSFNVNGVTDTVTLTGDYVEGYLDARFEGQNAVIVNGKLVGLKNGGFDADDDESENATLIVNTAETDDIKFDFNTDLRNLVSDINKGTKLDHRDETDDLSYLIQALHSPNGEKLSDRLSGEMVDADTFVINIEGSNGAVDTLTLTGDYIEELV